jgi:hypothetical protein
MYIKMCGAAMSRYTEREKVGKYKTRRKKINYLSGAPQ